MRKVRLRRSLCFERRAHSHTFPSLLVGLMAGVARRRVRQRPEADEEDIVVRDSQEASSTPGTPSTPKRRRVEGEEYHFEETRTNSTQQHAASHALTLTTHLHQAHICTNSAHALLRELNWRNHAIRNRNPRKPMQSPCNTRNSLNPCPSHLQST